MNNNEKNKVHSTANVVNPQANANTNSIITNDLPTVKKSWLALQSADTFKKEKLYTRFVVHELIPENSITLAFGPRGGGKSFVIDSIIEAVVSGRSIGTHEVDIDDACVVYLSGEGYLGFKQRMLGITQANGDGDDVLSRILACDAHFTIDEDETSESGVSGEEALETIFSNAKLKTGKDPALIVIDTLHTFLGGKENDELAAKKFLGVLRKVLKKHTHSAFLVIHHTPKGGDSKFTAKGSGAWENDTDGCWLIERVPEKEILENAEVRITCTKAKDFPEFKPISFTFKKVALDGQVNEDGSAVTTLAPEVTTSPSLIVDKTNDINSRRDMIVESIARNGQGYSIGEKALKEDLQETYKLTSGQLDAAFRMKAQHKPSRILAFGVDNGWWKRDNGAVSLVDDVLKANVDYLRQIPQKQPENADTGNAESEEEIPIEDDDVFETWDDDIPL